MPDNLPPIPETMKALTIVQPWYHDTILCYCADVEPWQWQRIAQHITQEARPCANGAPAQQK